MRMKPFIFLATTLILLSPAARADRCEEPARESDSLLCPGRFCKTPVNSEVFKTLKGLTAAAQQSADTGVKVFESAARDGKVIPLTEKPALRFSGKPDGDFEVTYDLNPDKKFQRLDGFGANFTESCAMNLLRLPKAKRREVMEKMFSKTKGAGFDFLRFPIGASDFADGAKGSYTYNDTKGNKPDPTFKHFSVSRDEKSFQLLKEAKEINPNLHVMITPWSAPAWMKDSKDIHGGTLAREHYQDYANYLVKTIKAYQKRGLKVTAMTPQNEPFYSTGGYPSMALDPDQQAHLLGDHVGPAFEKEKLNVRIFALDHNWSLSHVANDVLAYPPANKYVKGVAYHCYWGERFSMYDSYNAHPDKEMTNTECTGTDKLLDGATSHQDSDYQWWMENQSIGAVSMGPTGVSGSQGWNLCLDEKNGPQNGFKDGRFDNGGCTNCRGMVKLDFSKPEPEAIYNGEFHALAQLSRFIVPDARRVELAGEAENLNSVAIQNPDGSLVVAVQNTRDTPVKFRVRRPSCDSFVYEIPAKAAVTFTWNKN